MECTCKQVLPVPCGALVYPYAPLRRFPYPAVGKSTIHSHPTPLARYVICFVSADFLQTLITRHETKQHHSKRVVLSMNGTPIGNRTLDSAVRGRRLDRLTMRAYRIPFALAFE